LPHWDVSVLPSFTEGLPTVVLESYAAGVPVVATAVGGTPEAVADGLDGYLVPPGDPAQLAGRILELLGSNDRRREMGLRGRERIRAEFTFGVQGTRLERACEDVLARHRRPEPNRDWWCVWNRRRYERRSGGASRPIVRPAGGSELRRER
jgi:glycosyltransferase involved in cell wall biosynthesis